MISVILALLVSLRSRRPIPNRPSYGGAPAPTCGDGLKVALSCAGTVNQRYSRFTSIYGSSALDVPSLTMVNDRRTGRFGRAILRAAARLTVIAGTLVYFEAVAVWATGH